MKPLASRLISTAVCSFALISCNNDTVKTNDELKYNSSEAEALFLERYEATQSSGRRGGGLSSYDPLEKVPGASYIPLPKSDAQTIHQEALLMADRYAKEHNSSALLIWHNDRLAFEKYYGDQDRDKVLNSKSLAKPLAAIAIGAAIQQGYIESLDQPVANFITEWDGKESYSKITIRHLLGMTSGLLPQGIPDGPQSVLNRAYLHPYHDEVIIHEYPIVHEPGTRYDYSNANAELISPIIERATGQRYSAFLSESVLKPIGAAGGSIWVNREGGTAHSGCCILLPAESWLRIAKLLLKDGKLDGKQILPESYTAEMRKTTPDNPHAGLSVWVADEYIEKRGSLHPSIDFGKTYHGEPYAAEDLYLFDGNANQVIYIVPSEDLIILRTGGWSPKESPWDNSILPNLILRGIIKD